MDNYNSFKPSTIREENIKQIIKLLRKNDEFQSRADISRKLSLSPPSVSSIIKILLRKNILSEVSVGTSTNNGGRKPILLDINENCGFVVGIVILEEKIIMALSNVKGKILQIYRHTYSFTNPKNCIEFLENKLSDFLNKNEISRNKLLGIGVTVPGVFDSEEGKIKLAPRIKIWQKVKIREHLLEEFQCRVIIENATNSAVLGERWKGQINNRRNAVYVKVGSGIGAGIVLNGELYSGFQKLAGEIGFSITGKDQIPEQKGELGVLESNYSTRAITNRVNKEIYPEKKEMDFNFVMDVAKNGDEKVRKLLKEMSVSLSMVISNIICLLNPQVVVIGGKFSRIAPLFIDDIKDIVERVVPLSPEILVSKLGRKVYYLGAIAQLISEIEEIIINQYFRPL